MSKVKIIQKLSNGDLFTFEVIQTLERKENIAKCRKDTHNFQDTTGMTLQESAISTTGHALARFFGETSFHVYKPDTILAHY